MAMVDSGTARSAIPEAHDLGRAADPDAEPTSGGAAEHEHSPAHQPPAVSAPPPTVTLTEAGDLLRALAAPVRIAVVLQLRHGPRCVHELVEALEVTQPLISQHLRVLKAAGVVQGKRRGREVVYHLMDEHLAHIVIDAVAHVQEDTEAE